VAALCQQFRHRPGEVTGGARGSKFAAAMSPRPRCSALPALLALAAACSAAPADRSDPQDSFEPRSAPGQGQEFLGKMAGDFTVEKTIHRRSGDPVTTHGECRQAMVQGGRFLQSDFTFHGEQGDTTGMGLIGFDTESGRFTSFWIDSRSTRVSVRQSGEPFDGREIRLHSVAVGEGTEVRVSRTSTHVEADGSIVHRQVSVQPDGSERPVMELRLQRR
jgi:hypothetical protein